MIFSIASCATQKKAQDKERAALDSWLNHSKAELIQAWGPPTRYESDGKGGEILIYENTVKVANIIYGTYMEKNVINYKQMYVNSSGIIYYWRSGRM
jgi:hypothetical protein